MRKLARRWAAYQRRRVGRKGEALACHFLKKQGYFVWMRNWRCRHGELDIVAYRDKTLKFIEVKTRSQKFAEVFLPLSAIDKDKQRRLKRLARTFLLRHRKALRLRRLTAVAIDAITVVTSERWMGSPQITHVEHIGGEFRF